jgi:hypothetical protein
MLCHFVILCLLAATPAVAQDFACPKSGALEHQGVYTWTYNGPSADPRICSSLDSWSKPRDRIFNLYSSLWGYSASDTSQILTQMERLISGQAATITISFEDKSVHRWTFVGTETISIDNKLIETKVFTQHFEKRPGATVPLKVTLTRWLDTKHGMWVKARMDHLEGSSAFVGPWLNAYEDDHISYGS